MHVCSCLESFFQFSVWRVFQARLWCYAKLLFPKRHQNRWRSNDFEDEQPSDLSRECFKHASVGETCLSSGESFRHALVMQAPSSEVFQASTCGEYTICARLQRVTSMRLWRTHELSYKVPVLLNCHNARAMFRKRLLWPDHAPDIVATPRRHHDWRCPTFNQTVPRHHVWQRPVVNPVLA